MKVRRNRNHRLSKRTRSVADSVGNPRATLMGERKSLMNAPHRAKEIYQALRTALPPLLPGYLATQRWFGGKARQIRSVEITDLVPWTQTSPEAFVLLVRLEYTTGPGELYVLPLICTEEPTAESVSTSLKVHNGPRGTDLYLRNALTDDEFLRSLLDAIAKKAAFSGSAGEIRASCTSGFPALCGTTAADLQPRPIKAEQSNSSIIYGDRAVLKFFRRTAEGENPDLEIGRFLTEERDFPHIPAVAGWIAYKGQDDSEMSLGILQAFVPNVGDAWQFTLQALSSFWKEAEKYSELHPGAMLQNQGPAADARQNLPAPIIHHIRPYLDAVSQLGKRTAELHRALGAESTDPRFVPEPYTASFQREFREELQALAERNFALLAMKLEELPPELRDKASDLIARQGEILRTYDRVLGNPIRAMRTRIHGDYHLGQVLYTGSDFVILDFEGEPARPLSERRMKRSPLQDVAGMLRSFHYAAFSFHLASPDGATAEETKSYDVRPWAERWYACVAERFQKAYFENVVGAAFIPPDHDELFSLLRLHLLEKAVYELGYELNNRPAWVAIPLEGISQLLNS
jgi:maltose alpha-D-glucosyltransferase / alpha-amylase